MLAALIPLILGIAPQIAAHLFGSNGGAIATQVATAVTAVTGNNLSEPGGVEAAILAINGKSELAAQLQTQLATIAANAQIEANKAAAELRAADAAEFAASVASQASARQTTVDLVKAGSNIAWGAPVISGIVLTSFGAMVWLVMYRTVPPGSENLAMGMVEALKLLSVTVVGYWCGSSAGSARKDATISDGQKMLANSTPNG